MWATVLAQQIPSELTGWLTGSAVSVLAFGILAFVRGWIIPGGIYARALERNDECAAELRELQAIFLQQVVPALTRVTDLLARINEEQRSR